MTWETSLAGRTWGHSKCSLCFFLWNRIYFVYFHWAFCFISGMEVKQQAMKIAMKMMMRIYVYNNHLQILKLCRTLFQRYSCESARSDDLLKVTEQVCGRDRNRDCILRLRLVPYSWASSCKLCYAAWGSIASGCGGRGSTPKNQLSCTCWV